MNTEKKMLREWKEIFYRGLGRLLCALTRCRNRAQVASWKRDLGSADATTLLEYPLKITNPDRIQIGAGSRVGWGSWLCAVTEYFGQRFHPEIDIGRGCHVGNNAHIVATRKIRIGDNVMLADRVYVSDNLHDYRDVTRPIIRNELIVCGEVHIGDESWIGENACVIGDVRIGHHCVVGANAVVRRSLPDYSVAVGVPARIIRRYNPATERWEPTDPEGRFLSERNARGSAGKPVGGTISRKA